MKYDTDMLGFMSLFDRVTRAKLKDCRIHNDTVIFIVDEGQIGKAIGKQKSNLLKLEKSINRKIKIVEFSSKPERFIKNLAYPARIKVLGGGEGSLSVKPENSNSKALFMGPRRKNVVFYESIMKKYFDINEIKVE